MTREEAIETLKANYPDACYKQLREAVDAAIEALKAQDVPDTNVGNNGDAIYRQDAIDVVKRLMGDYELSRTVQTGLHILPSAQPEPQWIPCSKRLPKKIEKDYWICTDEGWQCVCRWRKFPSMRGDFWAWNVMHPVVAWMPRPEPYREGD